MASKRKTTGDVNAGASSPCRKKLAIISGAGPDAGIDVLQKVLGHNRKLLGSDYKSDRDAPYVVVFQVPGVGGPRGLRDLFEEDLAPYQLVWNSFEDTIRKINLLGLDRFCISCNTLHILQDKVCRLCSENKFSAEFVSIVDCVLDHCSDAGQKLAVFGSLPVTSTSAESPYSRLPNRVVLDEDVRSRLQALLTSVKMQPEKRQEQGALLEDLLNEVRADAYVLACSELPMLLPYLSEETLREKSLIDPGALLAERLLLE